MPNRRTYNVISLFSGAMGLDLGLEETDRFRVVACIEKDHACCETIRANLGAGRLNSGLVIFQKDIRKLDPADILESIGLQPGEVDLVIGGPPCQSFSTAGRRRTTQDPRGTLLWHFLRFIEVMQPKFFLMENVRGLLSAALQHRPIADRPDKGGAPLAPDEEPGSVVKLFIEDLRKTLECSYHMDIFEVNSVNYGAPQVRERALFIGNRFNVVVNFPDPTHGPNEEDTAQVALFEQDRRYPKTPWSTLRDAIGDLEEEDPEVLDFSPRKKHYLGMIPEGSNWRSLPVEIQKESMGRAWFAKGGRSGWWRRLTFDLPCPTLVTMPNHASTSLCHPTKTRALSIKEYARIQQFPDEWDFIGTTAEKYRQVGNAVPIRLGRTAGEVIAEELDRLNERGFKAYDDAPDAYRVVYVQSHVRTRQWYKNGKTFIWSNENLDAAYSTPKTRRKVKKLG